MRMPDTYKAGVAFAALVQDAEILRYAPDDDTVPTAEQLGALLSPTDEAAVVHLARTLLWLGEDARHTATWADLDVPLCLADWAHVDLDPRTLARAFGTQILGDAARFTLTETGRAALALPRAS